MSSDLDQPDSRSNRIICAKLYEGGIFHSYSTLRSIVTNPFIGKSPEFEIDIGLITKHAEAAFRRHMTFSLAAIALAFIGFIFNFFYLSSFLINGIRSENFILLLISWIFSIPAIGILFLKPILDRKVAFDNFSQDSYNPNYNLNRPFENNFLTNFCKWIIGNATISDQDKSEKQNIIVFGSYFPFIGSGIRIKSWNFVAPKSQNDMNHNKTQDDLSIADLYEAISTDIENKELPITAEFMLYADGNEMDKNKFLLDKNSKPLIYHENVDKFTKSKIENTFNDDIFKDYRVYFLFRYHDKARSTLLSTFLRFSKAGKDLFAECSSYILTPINEDIYNIDKLPRNYFHTIKLVLITLAVVAIYISGSFLPSFLPLLLLLITCFPLAYFLYFRIKDYKNVIDRIKGNEHHKYGILKTFRESIASPNYKSYFSAQDALMLQGSVEKSIVTSTAALLDKKGYDTSFVDKQIIPFVNNGIMQYGGTISDSNVVSGDRNIITQLTGATMSKINKIQQNIGISTTKDAQT
jgi:hypothetical protein